MRNEDISYFEEEEFQQDLNQYESARAEGQAPYMESDTLTDIAEYYMLKGREDEADACIELARTIHPDAIGPRVFIARRELLKGNLDKAGKLASQIKEIDDMDYCFLSAELSIAYGNPDAAYDMLSCYGRARMGDDHDYYLYDSATLFLDYGYAEYAQEIIDDLKVYNPQFERLDILQAEAYLLEYKYKDVISLTESLLDREPFNCTAWQLLGEAFCDSGEPEKGLEAAEYLLAIDEKNPPGQVLRAKCLYSLERFEEAHIAFQNYLKDWPADGTALFHDGLSEYQMGHLIKAIEQLQKSLKYFRTDTTEYFQARMNLASIYATAKREEEAIQTLDDTYQTVKMGMNMDYCMMRGYFCLEGNKLDEALEWFNKAVQKSYKKDATRLAIAIELIEHEHYRTALVWLEGLLVLSTDDMEGQCMPYKALALHFLPDHKEEFRACLKRALEVNPEETKRLFASIYPGDIPPSEYEA